MRARLTSRRRPSNSARGSARTARRRAGPASGWTTRRRKGLRICGKRSTARGRRKPDEASGSPLRLRGVGVLSELPLLVGVLSEASFGLLHFGEAHAGGDREEL